MNTYRADGGIWTGAALPGAFATTPASATTWVSGVGLRGHISGVRRHFLTNGASPGTQHYR